jgi:hypothetical protein
VERERDVTHPRDWVDEGVDDTPRWAYALFGASALIVVLTIVFVTVGLPGLND